MNAEVPGGCSGDPQPDAQAEPSADAAASDSDQQELTDDERRELEMAMERRAGFQSTHPDSAMGSPGRLDGILETVLAGITPLPGNLVSALNIASAEERRCAKRVKENPGDQDAIRLLDAARRQLARVRARADSYRPGQGKGPGVKSRDPVAASGFPVPKGADSRK